MCFSVFFCMTVIFKHTKRSKHNAGEYYKIQFVTCTAKAVERAERKGLVIEK